MQRARVLSPACSFSFLMFRPPPKSTLFPYTTLFRSTTTSRPGPVVVTSCVVVVVVTVVGSDRKSTRLNSSHVSISYAVFCLKKKKNQGDRMTKQDFCSGSCGRKPTECQGRNLHR